VANVRLAAPAVRGGLAQARAEALRLAGLLLPFRRVLGVRRGHLAGAVRPATPARSRAPRAPPCDGAAGRAGLLAGAGRGRCGRGAACGRRRAGGGAGRTGVALSASTRWSWGQPPGPATL